jgi:hypothetical protein
MSQFEPKSALYEKLRYFKKINLALVLFGGNRRKTCQKWILERLFSEI